MYYVNNIINTIVGFIFLAIICLVIFGLPAAMTVWNIISLTPKKDKVKNRRKKDIATLLLGFCLTAVMIKLISSYHWDEPVMIGGDLFSILHEPFSSDYVLSLVLYAAVPIACMMLAGREKLLPPLVGAFCIGGIYGGIFTPTEAAAVSAIYGLIVGIFIYKTLRFKEIVVILRQSVSQTAVVMLIIGCAAVFGKVLTFTGLASDASQGLISIAHGNKYTFLLMVNIILIIAGCFIDANSALYILCPILFPIAKTLGIDAVHLGAVMTVNLALGLITPPVGVNLFTGCGVAGITLTDMVKKIWPFVIAVLIVLLLVTYIPQISTILPSLMVK